MKITAQNQLCRVFNLSHLICRDEMKKYEAAQHKVTLPACDF